MKIIIMLVFCLFAGLRAYTQKGVVDTMVYRNWKTIGNCELSPDGDFVFYETYSHGTKVTMLISTRTSWKKELRNTDEVRFDSQGRFVAWRNVADSLCILSLKSGKEEWIKNVSAFKLCGNRKSEWIFYQFKNSKILILRDLLTEIQTSYSRVVDYQLLPDQQTALIRQQINDSTLSLSLLILNRNKLLPVWQGGSVNQLINSADGTTIAFLGSRQGQKAIWYFREGKDEAQKLTLESQKNYGSLKLTGFDNTCKKLFFSVEKNVTIRKPNPNLAAVDIYSYKDAKLQTQQLKELHSDTAYNYVYNVVTHRTVRLSGMNEFVSGPSNYDQASTKADYVLVVHYEGGDIYNEWNWNPSALTSIYLVSTSDGARKCISKNQPFLESGSYELSPCNKYVIYYDVSSRDYFSYNIQTGASKNITKGIQADWIEEATEDCPDANYEINSSYHWATDDKAIFISGKNDIYQADPVGDKTAINLTGNGESFNKTNFQFAKISNQSDKALDLKKPLLLHVVDLETRDEGFCQVTPGKENSEIAVKLMPYHIDELEKAAKVNFYKLKLESAESAPNWYLTRDFKTYTPLTNVHPEKSFNWLTAELIHFKTPDGSTTQGVLFKPENFDPQKKYPIIYEYYERNIVSLHGFTRPDPLFSDGGARINIPTYVSNGYLVFAPDIHYQIGHPGQSAFNTIIAATKYLAQFSWIDTAHMGLMGHSFGGFETNYIITHSHKFAAAASMSGMTNFISAYDSIIGNGGSRQRQYEIYRDRIGATLWERPDLYIENSPVLRADQVTTPVLLMANKKDNDVPYQQGFEFFIALRRLGKKAWLLQYDNGGHQVFESNDEKDVSIRIQQFFDYYLKENSPSKWMVTGVSASDKQIDSGIQADTTGMKP